MYTEGVHSVLMQKKKKKKKNREPAVVLNNATASAHAVKSKMDA
jgi:hypothetical protein